MRARVLAVPAMLLLAVACQRGNDAPGDPGARVMPSVRVGAADDEQSGPVWRPPRIDVTPANAQTLAARADTALAEGRYADDDASAIPLFLALSTHAPTAARARAGLGHAVSGLLRQGRQALAELDEEPDALERVQGAAAVLRVVALDRPDVERYLQRVDRVDEAQRFSRLGEEALARGDIGESGLGGALGWFRHALALRASDTRALQGLAAAESALLRRAEEAAEQEDYAAAGRWLAAAEHVRNDPGPVAQARGRIAFQRAARIGALRDAGIAALAQPRGVETARGHLAHILRIAPPADPTAAELRRRIDFAVHYGTFEPGQRFTDGLAGGSRSPPMMVIPHGVFRMGTPEREAGGMEAERPVRVIRFPRGFAMSITEITIGQFRRFIDATGHRARASRRGYSIIYDERSGNFVRRGNVDWTHDYAGRPGREDLPVVHVSAKDAAAYADWLAQQTRQRYRLPSEAEFEYVVRAGSQTRFPWGNGTPPPGAGNFTGQADRSPTGRRWENAFPRYLDGSWGPTPVARYSPGRFGLHDVAGNVSEWMADCWHASYRRAPRDQRPWVNPGCRQRSVRGGSWASSPEQTRSAWRSGLDVDTTNARIGFRVVRDL